VAPSRPAFGAAWAPSAAQPVPRPKKQQPLEQQRPSSIASERRGARRGAAAERTAAPPPRAGRTASRGRGNERRHDEPPQRGRAPTPPLVSRPSNPGPMPNGDQAKILCAKISHAGNSSEALLRLFDVHSTTLNNFHVANLWNKLGRQHDASEQQHLSRVRRLLSHTLDVVELGLCDARQLANVAHGVAKSHVRVQETQALYAALAAAAMRTGDRADPFQAAGAREHGVGICDSGRACRFAVRGGGGGGGGPKAERLRLSGSRQHGVGVCNGGRSRQCSVCSSGGGFGSQQPERLQRTNSHSFTSYPRAGPIQCDWGIW
jgi:hypothetical protein